MFALSRASLMPHTDEWGGNMRDGTQILATITVSGLKAGLEDRVIGLVEEVFGQRSMSSRLSSESDGMIEIRVEAAVVLPLAEDEVEVEAYVARHFAYGVWKINGGWASVRARFEVPMERPREIDVGPETYAQSHERLGLPAPA